jgi:hypothetical protein
MRVLTAGPAALIGGLLLLVLLAKVGGFSGFRPISSVDQFPASETSDKGSKLLKEKSSISKSVVDPPPPEKNKIELH